MSPLKPAVVLLVLAAFLSSPLAHADDGWKAYCTRSANAYAYAAKLRDLGKTQEETLKMVKAPIEPNASEVVRKSDIEMHKALVGNVFQHPLVSPQDIYDSTLKSCESADKDTTG